MSAASSPQPPVGMADDIFVFVFVSTFLQVTYCVNGFVDKNNDLLYRDLSQCLYACGHPLAKKLFPEGNRMMEICFDCCIVKVEVCMQWIGGATYAL